MNSNGLLDQDVREQVANSLVHHMLNSPPEIQEKILRMIVNRMSRLQIDTWYIAMHLYTDTATTQPHTLTDFMHTHEQHTSESE